MNAMQHLSRVLKDGIKRLASARGYEIRARGDRNPGGSGRPLLDFESFLQDLHARGFSPRCILDVGANRGHWTRLALRVFPAARYVLIEPQPEMRPWLNELCRAHANVAWVEAGAGREDREAVQTIWYDLDGSSFLPPVSEERMARGEQRTVDHAHDRSNPAGAERAGSRPRKARHPGLRA